MLLGLYEIVVAGEARPGNHSAHAKGVAAILQTDNTPQDLFGAVRSSRSVRFSAFHGAVQKCRMFSTPNNVNASQSLDNLVLSFSLSWRKADAFLADPLTASEDLKQLKREAMNLNQAFAEWQQAQVKDFNLQTVGHVSQGQARRNIETGYWPGKVDAYIDLYVAGVWNTARILRLLVIDLIVRLSQVLNDNDSLNAEHQDALRLVEDMVASIPFHLAEDLQVFLRDTGDGDAAVGMKSGRPVGGLLLMHPIYTASKLSIVSPQLQRYNRDCLEWIATHMGIGQASLFAKDPNIEAEYYADGWMIVWVGTLL